MSSLIMGHAVEPKRLLIRPDQIVTREEAGMEAERPIPLTVGYGMRFRVGRWRSSGPEPIFGAGPCLEPWFTDDDIMWFDRGLVPEDRELVVFEMLYRRRGDDGQWRYVKSLSVKQLRMTPRGPVLACNQGAVRAGMVQILGPVVAWKRKAWWRRPSVRKMDFPIDLKARMLGQESLAREA